MKSNQQGFTLIELIIVIVILGILAVTASPKFLDLQGDAKASTVQGLSASLKSASNIVYSKALVQGVGSGETGTTTNPAIDVVYGYPAATVATMQAILDISAKAAEGPNITNEVVTDWEISAVDGVAHLYPFGDYEVGVAALTDDLGCFVKYTEAADADTPATVTVNITAC